MISPRQCRERRIDSREIVIAWLFAAIMLVLPALISWRDADTPTDNPGAFRLAVRTFPIQGMLGLVEDHDTIEDHDDLAICEPDSPECNHDRVAGLRSGPGT
jgi:hypothetical protein